MLRLRNPNANALRKPEREILASDLKLISNGITALCDGQSLQEPASDRVLKL
jgi:hypothetical protein